MSTAEQLYDALGCFELQQPPGDHTITFGGDIANPDDIGLTVSGDMNTLEGRRLVVDGAGHTLTGPGPDGSSRVLLPTNGMLTVRDLTVDDAPIGAIYASSPTLLRTTVRDSGGFGLGGFGEITVVDSTFEGNTVGIHHEGFGSAILLGSTFADNTDEAYLGDPSHDRANMSVLVVNSTVADNGGGVSFRYSDFARAEVWNSTIVDNDAAGVWAPHDVRVVSSILSGNGYSKCAGAPASHSNFDTDGSCGDSTVLSAGSLGSLADNGGLTDTIALVAGSNAVDGGDCNAMPEDEPDEPWVSDRLAFDQRGPGFDRVIGESCDAGAFEVQTPVCDGKQVTIFWDTGSVATQGDDVIYGTGAADVIDGLGGDDTICSADGDDVVVGGDGNDRIFAGTGEDVARGNSGADHLEGGVGDDRLLGGVDDDELIGGEGNDYLGGFGGDDLIVGGTGDEIIYGGFGADTIWGDDGDDVIRGLVGNDVIGGGPGNDVIYGDRGSDTINGGAGSDVIRGGNAADVLFGDGGDDSVNGGRADDSLSGGFGTDVCVGNDQFVADTIDGSCETVFGVP